MFEFFAPEHRGISLRLNSIINDIDNVYSFLVLLSNRYGHVQSKLHKELEKVRFKINKYKENCYRSLVGNIIGLLDRR